MFKQATRQLVYFVLIIMPLFIQAQVNASIDVENYDNFEEWFGNIYEIRFVSPDSAIQLLQGGYDHFLAKEDYSGAVNSLVELAIVYGHKAEYQLAYDNLWKALLLADEHDDENAKMVAYVHLGRYYGFYKRKEQALEYFQKALTICKKLVAAGEVPESNLVPYYYSFVSVYRELEMPEKGKLYLDSCDMYFHPERNMASLGYLNFEKAFIHHITGGYDQALKEYNAVAPWFEQNNSGYFVLLDAYIGDAYFSKNDYTQAEIHYKKALVTSDELKSHLDFTPIIYERLSKLYLKKQDYEQAYASLQKEQALNASFFDSRSQHNSSLLEIKDDFRSEKEKQKFARLEQEKKVRWLQTILLIVTLVFLVFAGLIYFNYVRNKHRAEKELMRKKREFDVKQRELEHKQHELEIKQAQEFLELKNKELAASSLKLIEKEEILATLKKQLSQGKGDMKASDLKKIVRSISISNAQNWEEFETRFISVNREFLDKLNKNFPKLTRGDLKLCTLIKLNLTSKEIAKLMGISLESVHTNRYRLRKKLRLEKDVSLTEFVAKL